MTSENVASPHGSMVFELLDVKAGFDLFDRAVL